MVDRSPVFSLCVCVLRSDFPTMPKMLVLAIRSNVGDRINQVLDELCK